LVVLLVGFIGHRGYYSRKYRPFQENTLKERASSGTTVAANLLFLVALAATVGWLAVPRWVAWASLPLPAGLRWVGVGTALAGFGLLQWAQLTLGKNWSDTPRLMKGQTLTVEGPYRWVRHPIYTAFVLILGSTLLITANALVGLAWLSATVLDVLARVQYEEALMLATFGAPYQEYTARTGRFVPRIIP
jgi:protein-S-isoprenylcysteine O-methyltransferase Ste14